MNIGILDGMAEEDHWLLLKGRNDFHVIEVLKALDWLRDFHNPYFRDPSITLFSHGSGHIDAVCHGKKGGVSFQFSHISQFLEIFEKIKLQWESDKRLGFSTANTIQIAERVYHSPRG